VSLPDTSYEQCIKYLYGLTKFGRKLGLNNIRLLLSVLGDPQRRYPIIHVGGTNGKGSTCAMIARILTLAGRRPGLFTQPHLVEFTERIRMAGEMVLQAQMVEYTAEIRDAWRRVEAGEVGGPGVDIGDVTFFEFNTAMALLHFAREGADSAVVEVGLGGRFDPTNVVEPCLSAITSVDVDHTRQLGSRLSGIAFEKAGIIKPGRPVITAARQPAVLRVLREVAKERGAPLAEFERDFHVEATEGGRVDFHGRSLHLEALRPALRGAYQLPNIALALAACEELRSQGWDIPEEAIRRGVETVNWPGRLQVLRERPLVVLDGAHNPAAAQVLARALQTEFNYRRLYLVLGIMKDKDHRRIISILAPHAHEVACVMPRYPRALGSRALELATVGHGARVRRAASVGAALEEFLERAEPDDLICFTGSLFTVGEALTAWQGLEARGGEAEAPFLPQDKLSV